MAERPAGACVAQPLLDHRERGLAPRIEVQERGPVGVGAHEVVQAALGPGDLGGLLEERQAAIELSLVGNVHAERAGGVPSSAAAPSGASRATARASWASLALSAKRPSIIRCCARVASACAGPGSVPVA